MNPDLIIIYKYIIPVPSHQVNLLIFLSTVMLFSMIFIGLVMSFRSFPPLMSQLSLAWDQVLDSQTNSKQTFLKTNSHISGKLLPEQTSDLSCENKTPNETHKKPNRRKVSMVNVIYKANTHNAAGTVGGRRSEQAQFCLPHGN